MCFLSCPPLRLAGPSVHIASVGSPCIVEDRATRLSLRHARRPARAAAGIGDARRCGDRRPTNSVGVVATPARTPGVEVAPHARGTASERRSASKRSRSSPSALGALPQVRVLEPALVGVERVVHLPEAALQRRPPRPRRRRPRRAGAWSARGSGGRRGAAAAAAARVRDEAEVALEVGVLDHERGAAPAAADVVVVGRAAAAARCRGSPSRGGVGRRGRRRSGSRPAARRGSAPGSSTSRCPRGR